MPITVDRNHTQDGNLVFTITLKPCQSDILKTEDIHILKLIDTLQKEIAQEDESFLKKDVSNLLYEFKSEVYGKAESLIRNKIAVNLEQMFNPICQEIFSRLMDQQKDEVKAWMYEFNPGRTRYYFSNDQVAATCRMQQESEHDEND
jgi:hypothetical protein